MEQLLKQIEIYKGEIESYKLENEQAAENFRIKYLGTKGIVKSLMSEMKNVPGDKGKSLGKF